MTPSASPPLRLPRPEHSKPNRSGQPSSLPATFHSGPPGRPRARCGARSQTAPQARLGGATGAVGKATSLAPPPLASNSALRSHHFRWQNEEFPSPHEPIISDDTFAAAQALLEWRAEESPAKRLHNQEQRLLSGLIRCGRCGSRLFGVSANSRGQHFAYYACQKRSEAKGCDLPYIRANEIEEQLLADVQMVFRDEALLEEIWQAAKVLLAESAPDFDAEIKYVNEERVRNQADLDRHLHAFEAGTRSPADCSQRVA